MQSRNEPQSWWKWATTPPQSYGIYLAALVLMFVLSFYAGTLRPKGSSSSDFAMARRSIVGSREIMGGRLESRRGIVGVAEGRERVHQSLPHARSASPRASR